MRHAGRFAVIAFLCASLSIGALAQGFPGRFHSGSVYGNPGASEAEPSEATQTAMIDRAFGSTPGTFLVRGSSAWTAAVLSGSCTLASTGVITCATITPSIGLSASQGSTNNTPIPTSGLIYEDASYRVGGLGGLVMSNDGGAPNTAIDTTAGYAVSDDNTQLMKIGAFIKSTGAWALGSGTGKGCLDTGSVAASTWYHLFVIERVDTNVVDELCSLSATAPTFPANYTVKRRIGSFRINGSTQITAFTQNGREFLWSNGPSDDFNTTTLGTTATLFVMNVPTGVKVNVLFSASASVAGATNGVLFTSPDAFVQVASAATGNMSLEIEVSATTNVGVFNVRSNTSGQIRAVSTAASTVVHGGAYGWLDMAGQ